MKKVWLSSTYYLDPKFEGISATSERLFTRLLAYCGNAETEGFLPRNVFKTVGLSNGNRAFSDLIQRRIIVPAENDGYRFAAWSDWQDKGDKLVQRQKADRERKRKERERKDQMSRDQSRDVTPPEERRGDKKEESHVFESPQVSNRAGRNRGRQRVDEINGTAHSLEAHNIAKRYAESCNQTPPGDTIRGVALAADGCIRSGYTAEQVAEGIRGWEASVFTSTSKIPDFVHQAVNRPNSGNGNSQSKADFLQAAVLDPLEGLIHQQRRELQ